MSTSSSEYSAKAAGGRGKIVSAWACRGKSNSSEPTHCIIANRATKPKKETFIGSVGKGYGIRGR